MRRCSVPGCRSNFRPPYVSVFSFPKDPNISKLWLKNIGRPSLKIHENIGVCIKHFEKHFVCGISSSDSHRKKITIKHGSVPTIFEDDPYGYDDSKMEGNMRSLDKNARMQKSAKNPLSADSDSSVRKISKGDSNQSSPVKSQKKSSVATGRPTIAVIKAQDLIADKGAFENMDDDDCVVMEEPSSSSTSFSLPSPFKNLPSVSVCLKEEDRVPFTRELKGIKRSPSTGSNSSTGSSEHLKPGAITKRRKIEKPAPVVLGRDNDCYCWVCHRENTALCCIACPRAFHPKCAGETSMVSPDWVCPECQRILAAENVDTRSSTLAEISLDKLGALLKLSLNKMKQRAPPAFHQPVSLEQYPLYLHYVIHPMDLSLIEKNIKNKVYGCTEAFLADAKWIAHNSCVFNGTQYPLSTSAKNLVKSCELDMQEIEVCPDCFVHSIVRNKYWFSEVCRKPHPLVWAKLKGFPYWPAKVVRIVDGNVDARFFGAHDRAWVPVSQCYHLSKEMPTTSKPKKKGNYEVALDELNVHVHLLMQKFGCFEYAAYRTTFNPENKCLMYHGIDIEKAAKEDISFDTTASPSKMRFPSPEKENRFASFMENENEKASVDEERHEDILEDSKKVPHAVKETLFSFLFKDRLADSSTTVKETGLDQMTSERNSEEKKMDTVEEKQNTFKAPTIKKTEAISDSDQLRKLELVLERIKGYVSPNVDNENDEVDDKNEDNEKREEEESASDTENNNEKEKTKEPFLKSSPIRDSFLIPIIEKSKATESTENTVLASATEKKDSLKLNDIIESCKAMLGISDVTDDVDNESVADENASRSDDEDSSSDGDEENSSLSEGEAENETRNTEASDEEAENDAENEVKGDDSSEVEVTDDSEYEGEVEEESSSETSGTDVEDDSVKEQLSKKPNGPSQNEDSAQNVSEINDTSINLDAEPSKDGENESSKLGGNEESSSMDVIDEKSNDNVLESDEECDQVINSENVSVDKDWHDVSEIHIDSEASNSNQEIENLSLSVPLNANKPTSPGGLATSKPDSPVLKKNNNECGSEGVKDLAQLSKGATNNLNSCNNEDDEIMICDSPQARPKTPPVIVLDDDQENEDSSVSDTFAIKTSPHSTSAESLVNDENAPCQMNFDEHNMSSQKSTLVNGSVSKNTSVEDDKLKEKSSESTVNDKKRNLSFDDSSGDDIRIVSALKRSKLTGAIRTFNKPEGNPLISAPPRQELQEANLVKENHIPVKSTSPSLDKEQINDRESSTTLPESPGMDTSHLNDKDKEILFLKGKLNCVLKAYHIQSWKCTQEREELRHNMNLIIMEMRACLEADKKQAIEALTRNFEQEKMKCIDETKRKQWCASCRMESRYACCWNTSYCSVNCQKRHFPEHKTFCTQVKNRYTGVSSDTADGKQKISPNLAESSEKGNKVILLNMKTSGPPKTLPELSSVSSQQIATSKPQIQVVATKNQLQASSSPCVSSPIQFIIAPMKSTTSVSLATETMKSSSSLPLTAVHMPIAPKPTTLPTVSPSLPTTQSLTPILISSSVTSLSSPPTPSTTNEESIDQPTVHVSFNSSSYDCTNSAEEPTEYFLNEKSVVNPLKQTCQSLAAELKNDISSSNRNDTQSNNHILQQSETAEVNSLDESEDEDCFDSGGSPLNEGSEESEAQPEPGLSTEDEDSFDAGASPLNEGPEESEDAQPGPGQSTEQSTMQLPSSVSSNESSVTLESNKEAKLVHEMSERTKDKSLAESSQQKAIGVESFSEALKVHSSETLPPEKITIDTTVLPSVDLNWVENFVIPWDKIPVKLLSTLALRKRLSQHGLENMIRIILDTTLEINQNLRKKDLTVICKKIIQRYPESLSSGEPGNNSVSLLHLMEKRFDYVNSGGMLNKMKESNELDMSYQTTITSDSSTNSLEPVSEAPIRNEEIMTQNIKHEESVQYLIKSYNVNPLGKSGQANVLQSEGIVSKNIPGKKMIVFPKTVPLHWTQSFTIPMHKMPMKLLISLSMKQKLTIKQRFKMIDIICNAIQEITPNPGRNALSVVLQNIIKKHPGSLGHTANGVVVPGVYYSLLKHMIKRFKVDPGVICNEKTLNGKQCEKLGVSVKIANTNCYSSNVQPCSVPLDKTEDSNESKDEHQQTEQPEIDLAEKPDQANVFSSKDNLKNQEISSSQSPEVFSSMNSNWVENFTIPWEKMPTSLLKAILLKQRPSPKVRRAMIKIMSNSIQEITPKPDLKALSIICKNIVQMYPESFSDTFGREVIDDGYFSLLRQMVTLFSSLKLRLIFGKKYLSRKPSGKSCVSNKNPTTNSCSSQNDLLPRVHLSENEKVEESKAKLEAENVQQLSKSPIANPTGQQNTIVSENSSEILKIQEIISSRKVKSDWAESFVVPWDKMPEELLQALSVKRSPNPVDRQEMIRILCSSIQEIVPKPGRKALTIICRNIAQKYPESFSDTFCKEVIAEQYSLLNQMDNRSTNLNKGRTFRKKYASRKQFKKTYISKITATRSGVNSLNVMPSCEPLSESVDAVSNTELKSEDIQEQNSRIRYTRTCTLNKYVALNVLQSESCSDVKVHSNWAENFTIPWFKISKACLRTLAENKRLTPDRRAQVIAVIANSILKVNRYPKKPELVVICRKMVQKYPESLSDTINGEIIYGYFSSILKCMVHRIQHLRGKSCNRKKQIKQRYKETDLPQMMHMTNTDSSLSGLSSSVHLNENGETENLPTKPEQNQQLSKKKRSLNKFGKVNLLKSESCSGSPKVQEIAFSQTTDLLPLVDPNWAEKFAIPWHKMSDSFLRSLSKKVRPLSSDVRQMIRNITDSIQVICPNPTLKALSVICKKIVQKYPESLSDVINGKVLRGHYSSIFKCMVKRFLILNRRLKKQSKTCIKTGSNVHLNKNKFIKKSQEHLQQLSQNSNLLKESDQEGMLLDKNSSDSMGIGDITPYQDTELLPFVNPDWAENFVVPWNKMPINILSILSSRQRPCPDERHEIIRIISNSILEITPKPKKKDLSVICKNITQKYPESFCDTFCGVTVDKSYSSLLKEVVSSCENLNRLEMFHRNQLSKRPCDETDVSKNGATNIHCFNGIELKSCTVLLNRCDETAKLNKKMKVDRIRLSEMPKTNFLGECGLDDESCSRVQDQVDSLVNSDWAENFGIPWNKMPEKLLCRLTEKQRLSRNEKLSVIRIISDSIQKITVKPGKEALSVICKNIVQKYPESFSDALCGETTEEAYSSVLKQMEKRFDNLNTEMIFYKEEPDLIPLDDSEDEDWTNANHTAAPESSDESEEEELRKSRTTGDKDWLNANHSITTAKCDESEEEKLEKSQTTGQTNAVQECDFLPYVDPRWEEKFVIPWSKMPDTLLCALAEDKKPSLDDRKHMINIISDSIREITLKPGKKALSDICKNIVQKYPVSFRETLNGTVIHDSSTLLLKEMTDKFSRNRGNNCTVESKKSIKTSSILIKDLEHYGCINWQLPSFPKNENEKTQSSKKEKMKSLFQQRFKSLDLNYRTLLVDTYFSLRKDINRNHHIDFLHKEWPFLFVKDGLLDHFKVLVGVNILKKLNVAYSTKRSFIYAYLMTKPNGCDKKMMLDVLQEIDVKYGNVNNNCPSFAVVISLIMSYFGETKELLFLPVDNSCTVSQIENKLKDIASPCLVCRGNTMWSSTSFMLSIDSMVVNDDIKCFHDGLAMLFASFFVFNIKYPKLVGTTLEFIQRYFLGINPSNGTKIEKRKPEPNAKVMRLINGLNFFQWRPTYYS